MTITVTHAFVSTVPDDPSVPQEVRPSNWNADHVVSGANLIVTDGVNSVTDVTQITVTGGTVGGSSPDATLTISGLWLDKDSDYMASSGDFILADTTNIGSFTITIPSNPSDGATVTIFDGTSSFAGAPLTISSVKPIVLIGNTLTGSGPYIDAAKNDYLVLVYSSIEGVWRAASFLTPESGLGSLIDVATIYGNTDNIAIAMSEAKTLVARLSGGFNLLIGPGEQGAIHNLTGSSTENTFIGVGAGQNGATVSFNTVVGFGSLQDLNQDAGDDSGGAYDNNTVFGCNSLADLMVGQCNTVVGSGAANTPRTGGSFNTVVGAGADVANDGATHRIVVGYNATCAVDHTARIGGSNVIASIVGAATAVTSLPAAATIGAGARAFVTDSAANTFGASVGSGGGAYAVPCWTDGSAWYVG